MSDREIATITPWPVGAPAESGMRCPACGSANTAVKDSRPANMGTIRRRRRCERCGGRFTSHELTGDIFTLVKMATELDELVRNLRPEDVTLLRVIIAEMRRRGRRAAP